MTFNDVEGSVNGKIGRKKSDVAIIGVPFDMGTSNHAGQRNAPYAIRNAGFWPDDMSNLQHAVDPMDELAVVDCGDVEIVTGDTVGGWAAIRDRAKEVYANTRCMISIGGDHSCTAKLAEGVAAVDGYPLTIFHFDAHTDYYKHDPGVEMNHGTWVRKVLDDGVANRVVQFGVRGWGLSQIDRKWAVKNDVVTYYAQQQGWFKELVEEVKDTADNIYLSIDMDVLDPAFAPGVAYQEPGGLSTRELFQAILAITATGKVVAADVMEVIPDRDPTGITVKAANRVVAQLLTGLTLAKQ